MLEKQLTDLLKNNKAVNEKSETLTSFCVNSSPYKWSYPGEARALLPLLEALETAGFLKINR